MSNFLREEERKELRQQHRKEKDRRTADRIKAVLWWDEGLSYKQIAEALFLDEETISKQVNEYRSLHKLGIESGG
jgi:DNA-binding NarL/FixJ family response regulator